MVEHDAQSEAAEADVAESVNIASALVPAATLSTNIAATPNWAALPASVWYHILNPSGAVTKDARRTSKAFCAAYSTKVARLSSWGPLPAAVVSQPHLGQRFPCLTALHLKRGAARDAGWLPCLESALLGLPRLQVLSLQAFAVCASDLAQVCSALMAATCLSALHTLDLRNTLAGSQPAMDALAGLLRAGTHLSTLERLELGGNGIWGPSFAALCAALAAATHLTCLHALLLDRNSVPEGHMQLFTDAVLRARHLGGLQRLDFSNCQLKLESDMQQLGRLLVAATHMRDLRELRLGQSGITAAGATALAAALASPSATHLAPLRELDLNSWLLGDEGVGALARALASATHLARLEVLDFNATQHGDVSTVALALAIRGPAGHLASLRELYLHNNSISDEGAIALSRALKAAPVPLRLTVLALGRNRIKTEGVISLASALRLPAMRSLELLDLGLWHHAGRELDSGGEEHHWRRMVKRRIQGNRFGLHGVRVLASALAAATHLTSLRTLSLGGNMVRDAGLRSLVAALAAAPHLARLQMLEVVGCQVGEACVGEVEASVRAVSHLQQLVIKHKV